SSRRRHTRFSRDWSSDVCSSDLDVVARIGGDEFVVLLHRVDGAPQALVPAGKIVEALRQPFAVEGLTLHISCCVGVALYPDHGRSEERRVGKERRDAGRSYRLM